MQKDKQSDMYQITINNPINYGFSHNEIKEILISNFKTLEYFCMADEEGSTFHTHIFVCLTSRVRFSKIKKYFPKAHIEAVKGNVSENIAYIKKSGKWENDTKHGTSIKDSYEEWGEIPSNNKGKLRDMEELYQMVLDGWSNSEIIAKNQDYILQIDKLDKLRTIILTERFKGTRRLDLEVTYCYGVTGSGKTRSVLDEFGDYNVYRVTDYSHPFDSYNCQPVIVFDEFRSSLTIKDMLNYCDIYPLELPARFSNKYACFTKVFIISNWSLEMQYKDLQQIDKESWNAFLRRIKKVKVYYKDNVVSYDSITTYLNREMEL
ncbi:replication protein [Clostridium manihotivorum]|nr:replication protein [Clostridium manihotivorum]